MLGCDIEMYSLEENLRSVGRWLDPRLLSVGVERKEYSFDFAVPGDEFGHKTAVLAVANLVQGSEELYIMDKVLDYFAEAGGGSSSIRTKSPR